MKDIMLALIIIAIVGGACFYIYKEKKKGKKCIGCPNSCECNTADKCNCNSNGKDK